MNLLFFQCLDQAGGGSRVSLGETLRALREQRQAWQLTLITQDNGPLSQRVSGWGIGHRLAVFPQYRKLWQRPAFWRETRLLAKACSNLKPEAIVSNEWVTAPHAYEVARRLKVPAISYVRDFAALERGRKYQLHRMDRLLCVCDAMRQALLGRGYEPDKIRTVYNPVLPPVTTAPNSGIRARMVQAGDVDRWLLYLGRISARKNQQAAVKVLQQLRASSGQSWGLLLAGDADDSYAVKIQRLAAACGLADVVIQLGMVPQPGWLFELADASILTSKSEGLARVLIESLLCDKPAFAMPIAGLEDIYGDEMEFFVPARRHPAQLAAKIIEALKHGDSLRQRVAKLRTVLQHRHSIRHHVESFASAIRFP